MTKKLRLTSLLLAIALLFSTLSLAVSAEGFTYDDEDNLNCKSIFMLNLDTNTVVFTKNPDKRLPEASLTKIMSYIVAVENIPNFETVKITVPQSVADELSGTGSSMADLYVNEEFTGLQLLYLMMVPSGNDASLVLAKYYDSLQIEVDPISDDSLDSSDSENKDENTNEEDSEKTPNIPTFIDLMNQKAAELGCNDTNFTNPHGLYDPNHYSTARDMAKITQYALSLPFFSEITGVTYYEVPPTNIINESRYVYSTNKMLSQTAENAEYYYSYATGIKTGSLNESGYCIAAAGLYEGYSYIVIAMGSPYINEDGIRINYHGEMVDAKNLLRWAFLNLERKNVALVGDLMGDVMLEYAWKKDKLQVVAGENVSAILPKNVKTSSIIKVVDLPEKVHAPIKKGDVIGKATLTYADKEIASIPLVASESVEKSEIIQTIQQGQNFFSSPVFLIIVLAIVILIILYIILVIIYRSKKKKLRNVRRYRDI